MASTLEPTVAVVETHEEAESSSAPPVTVAGAEPTVTVVETHEEAESSSAPPVAVAGAEEEESSSAPIVGAEEAESSSAPVAGAEDEDTGAQVAPIVQLQEVAVTTGEEDEDVLLDLRAKLYRFDKDQWKERGAGTVKLLKHQTTGRVRLVMRQSKTLKICANHFVLSSTNVQEHAGNEKSCVWQANDFADGELKNETFCIRFASVENCKFFKELVEEIAESQAKPAAESEEGIAVASLIENLSVGSTAEETNQG